MDLKNMEIGTLKPVWWTRFRMTWKKLADTEIRGVYNTKKILWTCSCPAFLASEFLLCKHLIHGKELPQYREINRFHRPPFLRFEENEGMFFPNLMNEYKMARRRKSLDQSDNIGHNPIVSSPAQEVEDQRDFIKKDTLDLLKWTPNHVNNDLQGENQTKQVQYVRENVLGPLRRYKHNVEKNTNARILPPTWGCPDVLFLK